ncbi:MAG: sugar porter family MFS transporter, partial [Cyclobacteriaceae bacterium]
IALYGTVLGALLGGIPSNLIGRKKTLFWVGILYLVSALGSALAADDTVFMIFRFIGGLGVGASSVAAPMYISEIAPARSRGTLVALFQFNIVFGIVMAYISNYLLNDIGPEAWRWMLGVEAIPAFIYSILVLFVPRSPRWLIVRKEDHETAREILEKLDPENVDKSLTAIINSHQAARPKARASLFIKRYRFPVLLAITFAFFNQMAGINAIIYYAPRIFSMTGLEEGSALLSTTGIGITNLIFTMLGIVLIDRSGRKRLMLIGSIGLIIMLGLVSSAFYMEQFAGVPIFLFTYIAFFAMSQGAVIWVFISEIFPNEVRAQGQSLGSFVHWFMAAIITNVFPRMAEILGGGPIFLFFTVMMVLQLIFVISVMPETKGQSLEDLEKQLLA